MLTNAPLEPPVHDIRICLALESFAAKCTHRSQTQAPMHWRAEMGAASKLPDELDSARLFVIEVPDMKTAQCSQIVSPHDALEMPIPINDHA
jgi:hypothetical protein